MFRTFLGFELRYWLTGVMVYIFLAVICTMVMGAMSSDNIVIGQALENTYRNAPYAIQNFYAMLAIITCLMTTAFVNDAASRDFSRKTSQLVFTKPVNKFGYLMGRFWGSAAIALIPLLGVSISILLAPMMPWNDAARFGPVSWGAHLWSILVFAIPNTIFISAIVFAIAVWLRSTFASFIGIILLLMLYGVTGSLLGNLENETFVQLADPFGLATYNIETKYWTLDDRNTQYLTLAPGMMLYNRLIWLGVGLTIIGLSCWRFSFAERRARSKTLTAEQPVSSSAVALPDVSFSHGFGAQLSQLWSQYKVDFFGTIKSPIFLVIVFAGMFDNFMSMNMLAQEGFGLSSFPVTYQMVGVIQAGLLLYLGVVITFYAGVLVWKERDVKLDEIHDALPHSTWISYTAKLFSIFTIIAIVLLALMSMGVFNQWLAGYTRFQFEVYFLELFVITFSQFACFTVLAFFFHIISPNKYIGYFTFLVFVIANSLAWRAIDVETNMVKFGRFPGYTFSDMYGFAPSASALTWFGTYWVLFSVLLSCVGILLWRRGKEKGFFIRLGLGKKRFAGTMALATCASFAVWLGVAGWVYYNTQILNEYDTPEENIALQVEYEKDFKSYADFPVPRTTKIKYDIDLFPKKRAMTMKATESIVNRTDQPIETLLINVAENYETEVSIEGATLGETFEDFNIRIFKFEPPLSPGSETTMDYTVSYEAKGFENSLSNTAILQNGTFFNNSITPQMGYQKGFEVSNKNDRNRYDMGPPQLMPELDPDNVEARQNTYISNSSDWVEVETVISTSGDQIAIAPGSLVKRWQEDGRRYFHYKVDHPSLNMYSFVSADYKVALRELDGIDIEVYYHRDHEWNVDKMLYSIRSSLEYFKESFGPYKHNQARIIEFPRVAGFAQAFPGTMPYSEGIGFIADIKDQNDIDMVFYVVAHEMAHQWWAHQVIGADMFGATILSETLAQYSSLMVMEKKFGRDIMRKFLKYEMNSYLASRGRELLAERTLLEVGSQQGYVHYRKGSVVMYYLKEMIGEDKVNAALKSLIEKFAYGDAPYPTSVDLVDALREQTPAELQYLLTDMFEEITLFENWTDKTTYRKVGDKFEVTVDIHCQKFQADEEGKQSAVQIGDWIEIGAFAKPEGDSDFGKTLYRERKKINEEKNSFTFMVDEVPALAGVDPFSLLIDRLPDDNMKKPSLVD